MSESIRPHFQLPFRVSGIPQVSPAVALERCVSSATAEALVSRLRCDGTEGARCPCCGSMGGQAYLKAPDRFHGRARLYQLLRCPSCSLVWLENPPPPSDMARHYGEDYDRAVARAGSDPRQWVARRATLLRYKSAGRILDLGCSSGGFLECLSGMSWELCGIEMSERVAKQARTFTGAEVFVGDILDAPFPPASFDAITCFHVFEHLYEPGEVLAKVYEWLKPGGIFYTEMPNIDSAGARIFGSYWFPLELPRHLYHFSPASLRNLAGSARLHEVSITTHREVFIGSSVRYILDGIFTKLGINRTPLAQSKSPTLPWRVARKGFRLTVLPILEYTAGLAGEGEIINAVFKKV